MDMKILDFNNCFEYTHTPPTCTQNTVTSLSIFILIPPFVVVVAGLGLMFVRVSVHARRIGSMGTKIEFLWFIKESLDLIYIYIYI